MELAKTTKLIEDIAQDKPKENNINVSPESNNKAKVKECTMILNLKRQFKEVQKELDTRTQELEALKKNMKVTKYHELFIEHKSAIEELKKITALYEISLQHNKVIDQKLADFSTLQEEFNKQQFYLITLNDNYNKILDECKLKNEEVSNFKKIILKKKEEIVKSKKSLKAQIAINESKNGKEVDNIKRFYEKKIQELTKSIQQLKKNEYKIQIREEEIINLKLDPNNKVDNLLITMKNKLQEVSFQNEKNLVLNKVLKDQVIELEQELANFRAKSTF